MKPSVPIAKHDSHLLNLCLTEYPERNIQTTPTRSLGSFSSNSFTPVHYTQDLAGIENEAWLNAAMRSNKVSFNFMPGLDYAP